MHTSMQYQPCRIINNVYLIVSAKVSVTKSNKTKADALIQLLKRCPRPFLFFYIMFYKLSRQPAAACCRAS